MAAAASPASAFLVAPSARAASATASTTNWGPDSLEVRGLKSKLPMSSSGRMQATASAQAAPMFPKTGDDSLPSTFYDESPDWSVILAGITSLYLAAEKQRAILDHGPKEAQTTAGASDIGRLIQDGMIFRQNFSIRSYEVGADKTASIETLLNHLQETSLNHARVAGFLNDGFGATPEMSKRGLIWVVARMQVLVEQYPSWGDAVQVDSWVSSSGKNGMRREWEIRDARTDRILIRATRSAPHMGDDEQAHKETVQMPEEVRAEIQPFFFERTSTVEQDDRKVEKVDEETADYVREGLSARWTDLDCNQHVNNVKYISWVLESIPTSILESHELTSLTLEYRRECQRDSVLRSLTTIVELSGGGVECHHLLRLESGPEVVRGRTKWLPKSAGIPATHGGCQ
ncbi:unnamed protein product [Spirodela intermedia]|uniref:Acyl-[acyl-carrier-protein] hydrolase n=1 Tax=Spirodela intermedia TaxID=51605 RepID=A0A7I8JRB5_SPIIN|nr:unnamed protein product [Spirodela intermedia]CAA6672708.1 unnamed protein product [Spirodela intermedia]